MRVCPLYDLVSTGKSEAGYNISSYNSQWNEENKSLYISCVPFLCRKVVNKNPITGIYMKSLNEKVRCRLKSTIFWDITPCSLLKVNPCFRGTCRLHLQGRKIKRARNQRESRSQAELCFQWITRRYIPEDSTLHNHHCENLTSYISCLLLPVNLIRPIQFPPPHFFYPYSFGGGGAWSMQWIQ
jgi:hypothetical protein